VVVISGSARPGDVQRALDAGAASYVPKTAGIQEMLFALRRVLAGDPYLPPTLLASLAPTDHQPNSSQQINLDKLTERQKEVLHLLSQGLSNKGIANRLDLSEGTVKLHVSAIMRALGARNRTEAVLVAEQFG
jgi:DNA-binding NarL/FixJ family response regulator